MAQTPEGKVKSDLRDILHAHNITPAAKAGALLTKTSTGWYFMPPGTQFSIKGVPDFIGKYHGFFWAVETKAPKKKPTGFQKLQIDAINKSPGPCFVIDGDFTEFEAWLKGILKCTTTK